MFRSAILRSAGYATRSGVRNVSAIGRPVVKSSLPSSSRFAPAIVQVSRCYSSAAGLAKPEVEGRIVDLLKNFDKVCGRFWCSHEALLTFSPRLRIHRRYYQRAVLALPFLTNSNKLTPTSHFSNDLGLDSLDTVEVVMAIEEVSSF